MKTFCLEICAADIESVVAAKENGANRIELCSALELGGLTPSAGLIKMAKRLCHIPVNVLIRPRAGDFLYSQAEVEVMVGEIKCAVDLGADGIVVGALTAEGEIDIDTMNRLKVAAMHCPITFHRAFDMCCNPIDAIAQLIELGCTRLLTSGCAPTAEKGMNCIKQFTLLAKENLIVMPGCGVNEMNIQTIIKETGTTEIHASASSLFRSLMKYTNKQVKMGATDFDEFTRQRTDGNKVRRLRQLLDELQPM